MNKPPKPTQDQFSTRKEYIREYQKWMYHYDEAHRLKSDIYATTANIIRKFRDGAINFPPVTKRDRLVRAYVECTAAEFIEHIQNQFTGEMTWLNYGTLWELDHSLSLMDAYKKNGAEGMLAAAKYSNLRPRLIEENRAGKAGKSHKKASRFSYKVLSRTDVLVVEFSHVPAPMTFDLSFEPYLSDYNIRENSYGAIVAYPKAHVKDPRTFIGLAIGPAYRTEDVNRWRQTGDRYDFRRCCFEFAEGTKEERGNAASMRWYSKNKEHNTEAYQKRLAYSREYDRMRRQHKKICEQLMKEFKERT